MTSGPYRMLNSRAGRKIAELRSPENVVLSGIRLIPPHRLPVVYCW